MSNLHTVTYNAGDTGFLILCTMCVFLMVPGIGFLYSGLARRKNALSMLWLSLAAGMVAMAQWWLWGYSLAFSPTAHNKFLGNMYHFALRNAIDTEDTAYPTLIFAAYQGMFCAVTCALVIGAFAERARLWPCLLFTFCWATVVYCPLAYSVWGPDGWAGQNWGVLDYAGGGPVEIGSGAGALALALVIGRRRERLLINFRPHNVSMVVLGTSLLWFGWLGFNSGSAAGANLRAVYAVWNSNLCAAFGALSWSLLDWRLERKWSMVAVCSGIVSGLVAATPCSGVIPLWGSVVLGVVAGIACNLSTQIKYFINIDDSLDVFAEHGMAGVLGLLFNAFFGESWVIGLDGATDHPGGWLSNNWKQIYKQIAYIGWSFGWTFVVTLILAYGINYIPGCHLRVSEESEERGIDEDQVGEFAYDYVEVRRDFNSWSPPKIPGIMPADTPDNIPLPVKSDKMPKELESLHTSET